MQLEDYPIVITIKGYKFTGTLLEDDDRNISRSFIFRATETHKLLPDSYLNKRLPCVVTYLDVNYSAEYTLRVKQAVHAEGQQPFRIPVNGTGQITDENFKPI